MDLNAALELHQTAALADTRSAVFCLPRQDILRSTKTSNRDVYSSTSCEATGLRPVQPLTTLSYQSRHLDRVCFTI